MISLMEVFNLMGSLKLLSSVDLIEESTARFFNEVVSAWKGGLQSVGFS